MTKLFEPVMSRLKGWGFVLPALLWTAAFFAVPLIVMVCHSVWRFVDGRTVSDWTIANYESFFARNYLINALTNSLEVAVITTVLSVVLAYPLAYILAYRVSRHWQWLALLLTILPFWTSYLVRSYSWLLVLSERGFVNSTLLALTFVNEPLSMAHNRGATILGLTHFFTMLLTLTIFANLVQIKSSYRAAAADLGASPLQTFLRVTLPLSIPGVAVGAFLTFVVAIGDYITPTILGGGKELLLPQAIMLQIGRHGNFPMASALSVILMVVVTITFFAFARWLKMRRV